MTLETEEWRPVVGYEGAYAVSSLGRVRSLDRSWQQVSRNGNLYTHNRCGIPLALKTNRHGYVVTCLRTSGVSKHFTVHALVCAAFIGPRPSGMEIRHKNGIRCDNRVGNLVYGTRAENEKDKLAHGTILYGERSGKSTIPNSAVVEMHRLKAEGRSLRVIASLCGCTKGHAGKILRGELRTHG